VVLVFAYFLGIALIGAALGALLGHVLWLQFASGDPPWFVVVILCVLGAIGAMLVQRYVIILFTGFVGAWTLIIGLTAFAGNGLAFRRTPSASGVWILYPFAPSPGQPKWVSIAWVVLGAIGAAVQLGITGKKRID